MKGFVVVFVLMLSSSHAAAQSPWFAEITLGTAEIQSEASGEIEVPGAIITGGSRCMPVSRCYVDYALSGVETEGDLVAKLAVGRNLGRYFAVDLGYLQFKDFAGREELWQLNSMTTQSMQGLSLSGTAKFPITETLSLFAKAGVMRYDSEKTDAFFFPPRSASFFRPFDPTTAGLEPGDVYADDMRVEVTHDESGTAAIYSLGAAYAINSSLSLKLEYQHIPDIADIEIDLYSLGIAIRF